MKDIRIIHEPTDTEPFVVLDKPSGLPSAPLQAGDDCAYSRVCKIFPELNCVTGSKNIEHGLVHRLDTATRGILLIASTQKFYDYIKQIQEEGLFCKHYKATCTFMPNCTEVLGGFPKSLDVGFQNKSFNCVVKSMFRPYGKKSKEVRPVTSLSGKAATKKATSNIYTTNIILEKKDTVFNASCSLTKGFRHQVRCHLAWLGFPIIGDVLYNPNANSNDSFLFEATSCSFPDYFTKKTLTFSL